MNFTEPTEEAQFELREHGSRFYGYVFPVRSLEEVEDRLITLRKKYPDATHVCYAFRLGTKGDVYRASDDGEPKYSAGVPILNRIKSAGMTNGLVAVVRYYGGTNLGVPGLVKAYGGAAAMALENVPKQPALEEFRFEVVAEPANVGIVYDLARKGGVGVLLLEIDNTGSQRLCVYGKGPSLEIESQIRGKLG